LCSEKLDSIVEIWNKAGKDSVCLGSVVKVDDTSITILTAAHCVKGTKKVRVFFGPHEDHTDETSVEGNIGKRSKIKEKDSATVVVPRKGFEDIQAISVNFSYRVGDVVIVGTLPDDLVWSFEIARITQLRMTDQGWPQHVPEMEIKPIFPIPYGSSGGPVFNTSCELIGIFTGGNEDECGSSVEYAIPTDELCGFGIKCPDTKE